MDLHEPFTFTKVDWEVILYTPSVYLLVFLRFCLSLPLAYQALTAVAYVCAPFFLLFSRLCAARLGLWFTYVFAVAGLVSRRLPCCSFVHVSFLFSSFFSLFEYHQCFCLLSGYSVLCGGMCNDSAHVYLPYFLLFLVL